MTSIGGRLAFGIATSVVAAALLLIWLSRDAATDLARQYVVAGLQDDADTLLAGLTFDPAGRPVVESRRVPPVYDRSYSGHYFVVTLSDSTPALRSRSLWDQDLVVPGCVADTPCVAETTGPLQQRLIARVAEYQVDGQAVTVTIAEDISALDAHLTALQRRLGAVVVGLAAALLVAQSLILRLSLRPLDRVKDDCARLQRGEIAELNAKVPIELVPLVAEINRLVVALQTRLTRSRNALGNLAHTLKTPLARARQLTTEDRTPQGRAIDRALNDLETIVEGQLRRARVAGTGSTAQKVDIASMMRDLQAALERIHAARSIHLVTTIDPGTFVQGDHEDMLELFGNLLDNAFKWARLVVRVSARNEQGGQVQVVIEDDGPGIPVDLLDRVVDRGVRADETTDGHGLGLAICREILEQRGGELRLGRSADLGGLEATVTIKGTH